MSSEKPIKNVAITLLVCDSDRKVKIVVVQEKSGQWTNPGGKLSRTESEDMHGGPFRGAKREYYEETHLDLPDIRNESGQVRSYDIEHRDSRTRVYYGYCKNADAFRDFDRFRPAPSRSPEYNETIDIRLVEYDDILRNEYLYTSYFIRSLKEMEHVIRDLSAHLLREHGHSGGFIYQQCQNKNALYKHKYEKYNQKSNNIINIIELYKNMIKEI